jgi:hypothetical protein
MGTLKAPCPQRGEPMTAARVLALFTALAGPPALAQGAPAGAPSLSGAPLTDAAEAFERATGVRLHIMDDPSLTRGAMGADVGPVDPALVAPMLPVIQGVLLQYPPEIRGGMFEDLFLYGKLQMGGTPFLGAARPEKKAFLLAIRPRTEPDGLRSTLHHELAHLIEGDDRFDGAAWIAISAPYNGRLQDEPETKGVGAEQWWREGFVSRYASKNRHEDFAELAETAFTQPQRMRELAAEYDGLARKLELLTAAYEVYAPGMELPWTSRKATVAPPVKIPEPAGEPEAPVGDTGATREPPPPADPVARGGLGGRRRLDDKGNPIRR